MGYIPKYYLPQVKTGLCSIPLADFAIFINNLYRKCALSDLNSGLSYDLNFHNKDKKFIPEHTLSLGVNIFYQTKEQHSLFINTFGYMINDDNNDFDYISDSDDSNDAQNVFNQINTQKHQITNQTPALYTYIKNIINESNVYKRDFGKSHYEDFDILMELYDKGYISIYYCEPYILNSYYDNPFLKGQKKTPNVDNDLNKYISNCKNVINSFGYDDDDKIMIGFLPWKLFKSDIIYEERDDHYMEKYNNKIQETINIIKDINSSNLNDEKITKFKKYFPKSNILKDCGLEKSDAFDFLPKNIYYTD